MITPMKWRPCLDRKRAQYRGQTTDDRGQRPDNRCQMAREQMTEDRGRITDVRWQRTDDRGQRRADRLPWIRNVELKTDFSHCNSVSQVLICADRLATILPDDR